MTTETERAKKLADDHLSWVAGYNKALGLTMIPMAAAEYLYRTAIYHGVGHGIELERSGIFRPRIGDPLPPEEVERIIGEVAPLPLLCKTCGQEDCSTNRMNECEKYAQCARWIEKPASSFRERIAEAKEPQALDLSLPSITLPGDVDKVWMKYHEEYAEWARSNPNTIEGLMELWDCIQVLQTIAERGGHSDHLAELYTTAAKKFLGEGKPVMEAKRAMLLKNAHRLRPTIGGEQTHGYYSPEVCAIIIASNGGRWK
jgi:hypothetical protein